MTYQEMLAFHYENRHSGTFAHCQDPACINHRYELIVLEEKMLREANRG